MSIYFEFSTGKFRGKRTECYQLTETLSYFESSVRFVTSPCASLSVPAEESKGWSATIFYLLHSLIGKPKLILQIKNKSLTVSLLHFQSRPRGSKRHYILGRIYARIYPLDIEFLSCYNMCSGYIASSLKCYHFRTCEGGNPPFNPPFLESRKAHSVTVVAPKKERSKA